MENKWFLLMVRDDFKGGKITLEKALKLLEKLDIQCNTIHVKYIFKDNDRLKQGRITIEEFRTIYRIITYREEIIEIFNTYSENRKILLEKNLVEFLMREQYTLDFNKSIASEIIQKYEPIEEVKQAHQMSFEGFRRYMDSSECLLFDNKCDHVYQDMTHPLTDYFISSSHNTYLISDQLWGPSDLWGYISALVKGCRCLEIDCWDGSQNEPVVYHGYTFTSKLLFKTVIQAINKYAFLASEYPVVLSLENHCSPSQQEVMADSLLATFGDALLSYTLDNFSDRLPSPEALKFKILVRNKKIGTLHETLERKGSDMHGKVEEFEEEEEIEQEEDGSGAKEPEPVGDFQDDLAKEEQLKRVVGIPLFRKKKIKISMALSDLVIYTKVEKFKSFHHSHLYQQFNESNSIGESQARKLTKLAAREFILHTRRFITRVYPKALRADSSNFNPQEFWNLISGIQLPPSYQNKADTLVIVEIFGVPNDQMKQQSRVIKKNAFNPRWNETFTFVIQVPELALIRFVAENQGLIAGNEFLGQYTLPVLCMNRGYRRVPLFSKMGESLEPASLFIYVWYIR
ncbi:1-phosphatidylinositol 4,5-bisphosphate phosphodiesterase zeta-1 isoform X2 [Bos javanicus]|uniref:1-phosphatidylinositol 4,5-bisphosphate phosphodiesterase zeta-1 isoform X2 n=1 Tax=Bos taurus TaxID=9913 RepID=UPI0028CB5BE7|nr:1-phosphatidylinositol 4,5-bisphosphate phosphodiesterase zeta-1 isoform X2 [Bos taurus]XP_061273700.1 1-phosphatidylinositol 4,5-bisphosphate phosphodiesterase zeta-1 isoform X2 [Bos javanicus]